MMIKVYSTPKPYSNYSGPYIRKPQIIPTNPRSNPGAFNVEASIITNIIPLGSFLYLQYGKPQNPIQLIQPLKMRSAVAKHASSRGASRLSGAFSLLYSSVVEAELLA